MPNSSGWRSWRGLAGTEPAEPVWRPSSLRPLTKHFRRDSADRLPRLLKKEFRLQQISFLLAGLFVLIALTGACLIRFQSEWGRNVLGGDYLIYVIILPLIAGAISVAEEKGWDLAEWHLTLPPSALKQWSAKMLVALSTSLVLGLVAAGRPVAGGRSLFANWRRPRTPCRPLLRCSAGCWANCCSRAWRFMRLRFPILRCRPSSPPSPLSSRAGGPFVLARYWVR